jgi:hypothetical protein
MFGIENALSKVISQRDARPIGDRIVIKADLSPMMQCSVLLRKYPVETSSIRTPPSSGALERGADRT